MPTKKIETAGRGRRITGPARERMAAQLVAGYTAGMSIRELADKHQRSFGFVHAVLVETDTKLRPRGTQTGVAR